MAAKPASLSSAELFDYEAQLTRDELAPESKAEARDAVLRERIELSEDRIGVLKAWLSELRKDGSLFWPSASVGRIYGLLVAGALLSGLSVGTALMQGLLRYSGEQPVNILPFLAIFVFLPLVLLLLYALRSLLGRFAKENFRPFWPRLLGDISLRMLRRHIKQLQGQDAFVPAYLNRIRRLHPALIENYLWKILQVFGSVCYAAALLNFIASISVHDYSFGWSSTLSYRASAFHRLLEVLAFPFRWLGEATLPDLALVEASQFSRFERAFADPSVSSRETGGWWPFLALCITFYALLPRIILTAWFEHRIRSLLASLPFDDFMSVGLWQRLTRPRPYWSAEAGETATHRSSSAADLMQRSGEEGAVAVRWRDCPYSEDEIRGFFALQPGHEILSVVDAVGRSGDGARIVDELKRTGARDVLVICDPWELPGEAMERLRQQLRRGVETEVRMIFVPLGRIEEDGALALKGDMAAWRFAIGAYRDPYLGLLSSAARELP